MSRQFPGERNSTWYVALADHMLYYCPNDDDSCKVAAHIFDRREVGKRRHLGLFSSSHHTRGAAASAYVFSRANNFVFSGADNTGSGSGSGSGSSGAHIAVFFRNSSALHSSFVQARTLFFFPSFF
jgi:hypothetical protein